MYNVMQMGHVVSSAQRLDLSLIVGIRRCGNCYIDHPTDRCVIILNRTSVLRVKCPACARTPARRAPPVSRVLQRVHIGHDQYNQVLECGDNTLL